MAKTTIRGTVVKVAPDAMKLVAFSAEGRRLVSGSGEGIVKVSSAEHRALVATMRGSRMEEWITYTPRAHCIGSGRMVERVRMIVRTKFGPAPAEKWRVPAHSEDKVFGELAGTAKAETNK